MDIQLPVLDGYESNAAHQGRPGAEAHPDHRRDLLRPFRRRGEDARGGLRRLHREAVQPAPAPRQDQRIPPVLKASLARSSSHPRGRRHAREPRDPLGAARGERLQGRDRGGRRGGPRAGSRASARPHPPRHHDAEARRDLGRAGAEAGSRPQEHPGHSRHREGGHARHRRGARRGRRRLSDEALRARRAPRPRALHAAPEGAARHGAGAGPRARGVEQRPRGPRRRAGRADRAHRPAAAAPAAAGGRSRHRIAPITRCCSAAIGRR